MNCFNAEMVNISFYQKYVLLDNNAFIPYSWITVAHVLSKIQIVCHLDANGIKPGINSKIIDEHTAEYSNTGCFDLDWPQYSRKYQ